VDHEKSGLSLGLLVLTKDVAALGTINDTIHFSAAYNYEHRELLEAIEA
jgi:hypothetical protein